jgi:hypothetical protein
MWYTAQSGIWKTAWLEEVPEIYVTSLDVRTNADNRELVVEAGLSESGFGFALEVIDADGAVVVRGQTIVPEGETVVRCNIKLPEVHLWDVDDPYLYALRVQYDEDVVTSYCAFRTVGVEPDEGGVPRFCLNHRPVFVRGLLDQGYWPDGLMTPPSDEALVADIQAARDAGVPFCARSLGGMMGLFFLPELPQGFGDVMKADPAVFARFFNGMLERGVYLAPSIYEAGFVSIAHTDKEIDATIAAARESFALL